MRLRIALGLLTASALPATAQDIEAGRQLAFQWCSSCHATGDRPAGNDAAPSFRSIAQRPDVTRLSLTVFLGTPHHRMPDYSLTRQEIADVSAYILSMK